MTSSRISLAVTMATLATSACSEPPRGRTFYERTIEPILISTCAGNTGPCHRADPDDPFQFAAGNFDVTSFANVQKRRDLLETSGPYQVAPLLIKAVGPGNLSVPYNGAFVVLDIPHAGGANLQVGSDAYLTLLSWLDNGATENGLPPPAPPLTGEGPCATAVAPGFDPAAALADPTFDQFVADVQPVLEGCAAASCHGAPRADLYLTCGADDDQRAFNMTQARAFVTDPVDDSQLLEAPLASDAGGNGHAGGVHFTSRTDPAYLAVRAWATAAGPVMFGVDDPPRRFFADHVQPLLISRGCSFQACHSPAAANDFKLR
jgi:hypothetical protein